MNEIDSSSPYDKESISLLLSMPQRNSTITALLSFLKIIAIPLCFLGFIGLFSVLKENQSAASHLLQWIALLAITVLLIVAGFAIWFTAEYFLFERAPLGELVSSLFQGLSRKKIDKCRRIANSIVNKTNNVIQKDDIPPILARAVAYIMLAETSSSKEAAADPCKNSLAVFEHLNRLGLKTPLYHFLRAQAYRMLDIKAEAISSYRCYLSLCPEDKQSHDILNDLEKS